MARNRGDDAKGGSTHGSDNQQNSLLAKSPILLHAPGNAKIVISRQSDFYCFDRPFYAVIFPLRGKSTVHGRFDGSDLTQIVEPGAFSLIPGWGRLKVSYPEPLELLTTTVSPKQIASILEREGRQPPTTVDLVPTWQRSDAELVGLGHAFASFLRSPYRLSKLYAESLWTQITLKLLWNYSSLPRPSSPEAERLPDFRVRRVIEYMESTLAEDVSLLDLAKVADLSPNYLISAFRRTVGKTPHRYRTELRMTRACELWSHPHNSIIQVALLVGYSSQSHLTAVFRRMIGVTPAAYRNQVLKLPIED